MTDESGLDDLAMNELATGLCEEILEGLLGSAAEVHEVGDAVVIDCGIGVTGSLGIGQYLAEICMGGLASVVTDIGQVAGRPLPLVKVWIDEPTYGCLLSQYAGWKVALDGYFAMASGPLRSIRGKEPVFDRYAYSEPRDTAVGVLEADRLPNKRVVRYLCGELDIDPDQLTILVAPTASIAGTYQVVARSVETCLHKLFELGYDVSLIKSAVGSAFLPPVPKDGLVAIGRTNDSILYGGQVVLWVADKEDSILDIAPRIPASASSDYGRPFLDIFKQYGGDFYKIDPLLFSPAQVTINNVSTGRCITVGKVDEEILARSLFD